MEVSPELEAGAPPPHSTKRSILQRLASAVSRVLRPREPTSDSEKNTAGSSTRSNISSSSHFPYSVKGNYSEAESEEACAKVWSVYVGEAERYDAALVESWKADMEGMLIFSGLFSASLTAFIIESYKNLQPDSGDLTVAAISQVSQQLAAIASGKTFVLQATVPFTPATESLWCNALWFISLALSLTCALLATLVEQWAREFLHKTEMRPSPVRRARIFSFLYFGLKRFRMHTIVDAIPFLLHASLLLFFAGLVAFLLPVNRIMMYLIGIALSAFIILYTILTVLPVVQLDCPYRTPLSALLWSLLQNPFNLLASPETSSQRTITEAVLDCALQDTKKRDQHALKWTLDSLTDDVELLPFVEAIPDIIHGPNGLLRRVNDELFMAILGDTEVASPLVTRICNLIAGTQGMLPDDTLAIRRRSAGFKALWALCLMPCAWDRRFDIDFTALGPLARDSFRPTVLLAVLYQRQSWVSHLLGKLHELLRNAGRSPEHLHDKVIREVHSLLRLSVDHEDLFILPLHPIDSVVHPMNPWVLSTHEFKKLQALDTEIGDSLPTASQLDSAQKIVAALYDEHDWALNSTDLIARFITDTMDQDLDPVFDPLIACNTIFAEINSSPPRDYLYSLGFSLSFPSDMHKIEFLSTNPHQMDIFARIAFGLSAFVEINPYTLRYYLSYVIHRRNGEAIRYALEGCDLFPLAKTLSRNFWFEAHSRDPDLNPADLNPADNFTQLMHTITVIAIVILSDSAAIEFIDIVLAGGPPDLTSHNSEFWAVKNLRSVRQLQQEMEHLQFDPWPSFAQLQEICQDVFMRPLYPSSLPKDVDVSEAVYSLGNYLLDKYILFFSDLFENRTMAWAISGLSPFDGFTFSQRINWNIQSWERVDPEIQHSMFGAVLAAARHPLDREGTSKMVFIQQLWSSNLFWDVQFRDYPYIEGIQSACLPLLVESLELYHEAAESQTEDGISLDTTDSKKILVAVRKRLEPPTPSDGDSMYYDYDASDTGSQNVEEDMVYTRDEPLVHEGAFGLQPDQPEAKDEGDLDGSAEVE
ncbi:hypothetical protein B0H11DRAFT_57793 [Mycena galericulata]|nr:hypothetical protein B0H11DRAFT_57793 [Mycena galericulata]